MHPPCGLAGARLNIGTAQLGLSACLANTEQGLKGVFAQGKADRPCPNSCTSLGSRRPGLEAAAAREQVIRPVLRPKSGHLSRS